MSNTKVDFAQMSEEEQKQWLAGRIQHLHEEQQKLRQKVLETQNSTIENQLDYKHDTAQNLEDYLKTLK